ncbi:MAG: hypothetical protein ABSE64_09140 [Vulcanimicrobiaceae bacterium]
MFCSICALLFASLLSACGGGGSKTSAVPQAANPKSTSAPTSYTNVAVNVLSPSAQSLSAQRHAKYISPATNSMTVAVNGGQPATVALTTGSPNCSLNSNSDLICTATVSAPEGPSDSFVITLYSGNAGTGAALSTATVVQAVTAGTNNLNVTLNGVVASINLSLQNTSLNAGATGTTMLAVNALDSSGNTIVGPGGYSDANGNALTVNIAATQNAPTIQSPYTAGAATLGLSSVTSPSQAITVSYNGYALLSTVFTATVTGGATIAPATTTLTLTPTVYEYPISGSYGPEHMTVGPDKQIWIALFGISALYHFVPVAPGGSSLNGTTVSTPTTNLSIAAGSDGNLWFVDWNQGVYKVAPTGGTVYTFTVPTNKPDGIVDGGDGNIYVQYSYYTGPSYFPINTTPGSITPTIYAAYGSGGGGGNDITVGPDKRVWATSGQYGCCSVEFLYAQQTSVSTIQTSTAYDFGGLPGTGISWVTAGSDGNMWYSERNNDTIGKLAPSATSASQRIDLPMTSGTGPYVLVAGPDGAIYVIETGFNKIGRVPTTATPGNLGLTEYLAPAGSLNDVISGPDGNVWFIEANNIGKLAL